MSTRAILPLLAAPALLAGCPGAQVKQTFDRPVPADEPRAELRLGLKLPASQDCEEAFDLALYRHEGVELIRWERADRACGDRSVTVRYLRRRVSKEELIRLARKVALKVRPDARPRSEEDR
jgi:hypothetical protein